MNLITGDKLMGIASVLMRVPPLFIIDELLRIGVGLPEKFILLNNNTSVQNTYVGSLTSAAGESAILPYFGIFSFHYHTYISTVLRFITSSLGILVSLYIFMLWTGRLIIVYMYLISVGTIFLSYWSNENMIQAIVSYTSSINAPSSILDDILRLNINHLLTHGPGITIIQNYILQTILACLFCYMHLAPRHPLIERLLFASFLIPSALGIFPLPTNILNHSPVISALLPLLLCKFILWYNSINILKTIKSGYQLSVDFVNDYGITALAELEWMRLSVPNVLRTFWLLRVGEQIIQLLDKHYDDETFTIYIMIRTLMVNGCETLTALLGMTSIVSLICHYIGCFFHWILLSEDDEEKNIGTVSAVLFYILALQTGLTGLDSDKRFILLSRNLCLLSTAVLHFIHNIVYPVLMSLSASHNPALRRHIRALAVCLFLIVFASSLLVFLWSHFTMSTWLLAVSIFSIEAIVKVTVSLAIYSLFLFDAYRSTFWEPLDDCLYIIRSFGNTVEFTFGVILFFNGIWILVFESGSSLRAIMTGIHAYFNIWNEAKLGWSVFMKRRTAVNKINSLPEANEEQLRRLEDVCAICYQEMKSAKVTRCNHIFHGVCLRKWLYVQDKCPLCHDILYKVDSTDTKCDTTNGVDNAVRQADNERHDLNGNTNIIRMA